MNPFAQLIEQVTHKHAPKRRQPKPVPPPTARERLLAALDMTLRDAPEVAERAGVGAGTAFSHLPGLVALGFAECQAVRWTKGSKRMYRRVA